MLAESKLIVVAGPNGSGKSTLTAAGLAGDAPVIDPDAIARNMNPADPNAAALSAGKEALRRQRSTMERGETFAVETTLSGNRPLNLMAEAKNAGYVVELHYVRVGTPELNIDRIAQRVADGGHYVPNDDVTRRYERSMENLPTAISLADSAVLYDNSGRHAEQVAELSRDRFLFSENAPRWAVRAAYDAANLYSEQAGVASEFDAAQLRKAEAAVAAKAMTEDELEQKRAELEPKGVRNLGDDFSI